MLELNEYYYYANLALYYCDDCGGEFIVSCEKTTNAWPEMLRSVPIAVLLKPNANPLPRIRIAHSII